MITKTASSSYEVLQHPPPQTMMRPASSSIVPDFKAKNIISNFLPLPTLLGTKSEKEHNK